MKQPNEYSDYEIYEMLLPKLEKAGLNSPTFVDYLTGKQYSVYQKTNDGYRPLEFEEKTKQAIALAYKSGYLRAQKGRRFIIGEKKPAIKVVPVVRYVGTNKEDKFTKFPEQGMVGKVWKMDEPFAIVDWGKCKDIKWHHPLSHLEVIE